jgi:polyisoprenoid-binding protein YceI
MKWSVVPALAFTCALALAGVAPAAEQSLTLDPAATKIAFTLGATLHTAEGTIRLERGTLRFDPDSGTASGEIVVDAKSAETGSDSRDANMHRDVLESGRFPVIVFRPERLEVVARAATTADVKLHGRIEIHGGAHPLTIPAKLTADGPRLRISASFRVPYVEWGMRDYSNLVLRVDKHVDVTLEAAGHLN